MGKRKTKAKVPTKRKKLTLPKKTFDCPVCGTDKSVIVTIDRKNRIGSLRCTECSESFEKRINVHLEEAVDVFTEWADSLRDQQQNAPAQGTQDEGETYSPDYQEGADDMAPGSLFDKSPGSFGDDDLFGLPEEEEPETMGLVNDDDLDDLADD
ncbi:Transcription elongation factor 1 [Carpediemonas membranifera]|uniref:Transcription elongation factor 1 homolog n=1 Tax=Carpediemonas membranifera TaxID=201153 RepID=A0A8J6E2W6_9EUKA|nr:Transcription elongation factor 1 [Carpediemonas membranifera]|eukprot:KAG9395183.1 Transcription elongation factor 1 [Carpediemonas membranifera]